MAISNFIDQNDLFRILTAIIFTLQSNEYYRSLRCSTPLDDRLWGLVYEKNGLLTQSVSKRGDFAPKAQVYSVKTKYKRPPQKYS